MTSTLSSEDVATTPERAPGGRFAKGNPGGPGNPFARQTAALRAALLNAITERDIQDILDVLLLNAKGGHLPSIKLLFSYVLGKPKLVVEPDLLDLQEMQMLQQGAVPSEALDALCGQLPLDLQVQLTRVTQVENAAAAVQTALDNASTADTPLQTPPPGVPSNNGDYGDPHGPVAASFQLADSTAFGKLETCRHRSPAVEGPSTLGNNGESQEVKRTDRPSTNGEKPPRPRLAGFDWLREIRRGARPPGRRSGA